MVERNTFLVNTHYIFFGELFDAKYHYFAFYWLLFDNIKKQNEPKRVTI